MSVCYGTSYMYLLLWSYRQLWLSRLGFFTIEMFMIITVDAGLMLSGTEQETIIVHY